jgi:hypothetical protein
MHDRLVFEAVKVRIFIVSFHRDVEFLRYCLKSIQKYATGFEGVTIAVPINEHLLFDWVKDYGADLGVFEEDPAKGMMHHEYEKMTADIWCPSADAILHLDSDCMFWEPASPDDFFVNGKPILFRERYATLKNKLRLHWKKAVFDATGIDPEWETMVRHPAVHLRETYAITRTVIFGHTKRPVREYILSCRNEFPQEFAEFPTLGSVAIAHIPGKYHFVEYDVTTPDGGYPYDRERDFVTAHWSHGGIERYREVSEAILR